MPADTPVITPVAELTEATSRLLLLHVPDPGFVNVVVAAAQTEEEPVIAEGIALTVIVLVADVAVGVTMHE